MNDMEKVFQIEEISKSEFIELIDQRLENFVQKFEQQKCSTNDSLEKPVGTKEIAKLLDRSVTTIYTYCKKHIIPFKKLPENNRLQFFPSEVLAAMREFKNQENDYNFLFNN
jgi:predicted PolB exonuclease-like 3'-5' exonuclease